MIDRQTPVADVQGPVDDHRRAFGDDTLVIGLKRLGLKGIAQGALDDVFADDFLAAGIECFEIALIATLQPALAVAHVNWMRCAVDQRTHEFELVVQRSFGSLAFFDLVAHVSVPDQQQQQ
ncbi:hypothetical protein D3C81_1727130 [compost metagenome]